jgi:hypothetical protein
LFQENGAVSTFPLPDEQRTGLLATYSADVSPNQRIDVTLEGN